MEGYSLILILVAAVSLSGAQSPAPANIIVAPSAPADFYGGRMSIPCAAFGSPAPNITWSSTPLGISNFADGYFGSLAVNVATRQVVAAEGTVTISILEICNANYTLAGIGDLITCSADNGVPTNSSFLSSVSVSFTPNVTEPVSIVAAPLSRYLYNGSRLVATCVARGSPKASITWSAPSLNITDFSNNYRFFASFFVTSMDVVLGSNDTVYTVSTLEICADNIDALTAYFTPIWCSARNSPNVPPTVATFTPDPYNEFVSLSIRTGTTTANLTFTFAGHYDTEFLDCFLDKLVFTNNAGTVTYRPTYPGTCVNLSPNQVIATIDPRDYINLIMMEFFVRFTTDISVYSAPGVEFDVPFDMPPINISTPLQPLTYFVSTELPSVVGFDMDLNAKLLFIHFTGIMHFTTFSPIDFVFIMFDSQLQRREYRLTNSQPTSNIGGILYSFCIQLSDDDLTAMRQGGFCTSPETCTVYFSSNLASDVFGNGVSDVPPTVPLQVALFTEETLPLTPNLYMQVLVDVASCQRTRVLEENEMYISKSGERIVSISCIASGFESNPSITWSPLLEAMSDDTVLESELFAFDWPNAVTLSFEDGLPENYQGLFNCTSDSGNSISNYIIDINPYVGLENDTYEVRLFDDVNIPVRFGSYPPIDLRDPQVDVSLFRAGGSDPAPVEPQTSFQSPHMAVLSYPNIDYRINDVYEGFQVRITNTRSGTILASREINIYVRDPDITIIPPVAAVLPTDTRIRFTCRTNSPELPVVWVAEDLRTELRAGSTYDVAVPSGGLAGRMFICAVRDPTPNTNNQFFVSYKNSTVRNIREPLSAWRDGVLLANNSVTVTNRFSGSLNLTCLGHYPTDNVDLSWIIVPDGGVPMSAEMNTTSYNVTFEENVATLMIDNRVQPFRGAIKCVSGGSGESVNVFVRGEQNDNLMFCPNGDKDVMWGIVWSQVLEGGRDIQPCPSLDGKPTNGFASRECTTGGVWDDVVDVSGCSSQAISEIGNQVNDLLENSDRLPADEVYSIISEITRSLVNVTTTGSTGGAQFTQDLQQSNNFIQIIVSVLTDGVNMAPSGTSFQNELGDVLNNLLHRNNLPGWAELETTNPGTSQTLLMNIQSYGNYISQALLSDNIDTSQFEAEDDQITIEREYISYNVRSVPSTDKVDIVYPPSSSPAYSEGRIELSAELLEEQQTTGVIIVVIKNIGEFLPDPSNPNQNVTSLVGSNVISTEFIPPIQAPLENNLINIYLTTNSILGAVNPRGAFFVFDLNGGAGSWETQGLSDGAVENVDIGESKSYEVSFSARRAGVFTVIVDQVTVEFNLTVPVYVGCGVIIFSAVMSLFCLLLSCLVDSVRKYFTTPFFIHISFIFSLLAAYVSFLVGIELGLESRIGCAAVAGILHYFFTAAFTWLLFESLLVMMFGTLSRSCGSVFLLFFLGWGIPAIPTAISLGLLHGQYGTSQHCWFFFDGVVTSPVVLGFIIPKLVLILLTMCVLVIGVCTNFKFQITKRQMQPHLKRPYVCMLWFVWLSTLFLLLLLAASWVFLMLLVNVYGLDSSALGWIFMGVTIALGIYMFLFSFVVLVVNQKIDYKYLWEEKSDTYVDDPHRGRDYEIMRPPTPKLGPVSRPVVIDNPVFDEKAPPLADAPAPDDDDSFEDDDDEEPGQPTNLDDSIEDDEQTSDLKSPLVEN